VVIEAQIAAHESDGLSLLDFPGGQLYVSQRPEAPGHRLRCRIHARDVSLALEKPPTSSILNSFAATVSEVTEAPTKGHVLVQLHVGPTPLLARITERSRKVLAIKTGQTLWAQVKAVALLA